MTKLKPLGDKILIRPLEAEAKTKSGIIVPDSAKEKPQEGEVIAVGSGKIVEGKVQPLEVKVKDKVLFSKHLAVMLKSGIPIAEAVLSLKDQTTNLAFKEVLEEIYIDINNGQTLEKALSKHPKVFDSL